MAFPLIVVVGPTASGKTGVAIHLARHLDGEIVSADSMQIYREMPIGTAQPSADERLGIVHHMVGCVDPRESYNVTQYQQQARAIVHDIAERRKQPIVCGGTGLYVDALLYPMSFTPAGVDEAFRAEMQTIAYTDGIVTLHQRLAAVDPKAAQHIHPNNVKRVIRALEVHHLTGQPFSSFEQQEKRASIYPNILWIGLTMSREMLYARIERRVDAMMQAGLADEVKALIDGEWILVFPSMQGLGYKEIVASMHGVMTLAEAVDTIKRETRHYAKRQYTWFKREPKIRWFHADSYPDTASMHEAILQYCIPELQNQS